MIIMKPALVLPPPSFIINMLHFLILSLHFIAEGHSIYVRNLPLNVTDSQLEEEFMKFGPIKQGGVQVRSNKVKFQQVIQSTFALFDSLFAYSRIYGVCFVPLSTNRISVLALLNFEVLAP